MRIDIPPGRLGALGCNREYRSVKVMTVENREKPKPETAQPGMVPGRRWPQRDRMKSSPTAPEFPPKPDNGPTAGTAAPTPKMSVVQAAAYLGVSKSWLDKKRLDGAGPPYLKLGRRVVYDLGELEAWAASHKRHHTSEAT